MLVIIGPYQLRETNLISIIMMLSQRILSIWLLIVSMQQDGTISIIMHLLVPNLQRKNVVK